MMLDAALKYAEMGLAVFPLKPGDKTPLTRHGCKEATTDATQIRKWFNRAPEANIGIATGSISGGLVVVDLDIDEQKGLDGYEMLVDWERDNGKLPETVSSITGRGGYHYYFRTSEIIKNRAGVLEGIDVRGEGGYVVAPPSVHSNGNQYEWEFDPSEYAIAEADDVVLKLLSICKDKSSSQEGEIQKLDVNALIQEGGRNDGIFRVGAHYQAHSRSDWEVRTLMIQANKDNCKPPLGDDEMDKLIASVLKLPKGKSPEFLHRKHDKNHQKIMDIVEEIHDNPQLCNAIRYNTLAYSPWVAGELPWSESTQREWTDVDDSQYLAYMESEYNFYKKENLMRALDIVQSENQFNPVIEHLETLKWDGVPRMETLLTVFLGADDNEVNRAIMSIFMYGAIARVYHPGCQFDLMLVLVGGQGIGKSTFLRKLTMVDEWFDGNFNSIEGTGAIERLRGNWILEMAELLSMKRAKEVEAIKSFITNRFDNFRAPYARRTTKRPRQCVFAGTSNPKHFLSDPTGNRRFMPVEVHEDKVQIDAASYEGDYFEQAWAEALHKYKTENPKLYFDKEMEKKVAAVREEFSEEDTRVGLIQNYLDKLSPDKRRVCVLDIWSDGMFCDISKITLKETKEIHAIMREKITGWHCVGRQRCDYGNQTCYERDAWVPVPEGEQIPFDAE